MLSLRATHFRSLWIWLLSLAASGGAALVATHALRKKPAPAIQVPQAVGQPARPADVALPNSTESDARLRDTLSGLTPRELFHHWLENDHLLDRLVVITVNLAEDQNPKRELSFLQPTRPFKTAGDGTETIISPHSYARYDAFANVISSLDNRRVATAYRTLHPLLESAYHALGYPGRPLDAVVASALQRIVNAPVREEVAVRRVGPLWLYRDSQLESLGPVEKQLLRMGPRNTRLLQEEAREIAGELGFHLQGDFQAATGR